jgi:hypothetical protein
VRRMQCLLRVEESSFHRFCCRRAQNQFEHR